MLLATFHAGDLVLTLKARRPLSTDDTPTVFYTLTFEDMVTNQRYDHVLSEENHAYRLFAAAIVCDEPTGLSKLVAELYATPARKFIP